jgi:hypothetical protein
VSALAEEATAALPPTLIERTLRAATSGVAAHGVAVLTQGVLHSFIWKKARTALLSVLAVGLVGSTVGAFFARGVMHEGQRSDVGAAPQKLTPPPLDRKKLLEEFARADTVFVGKVVHADLEETFWGGWMMSTKEVNYAVSRFVKGGGNVPTRRTARLLILGGPSDAYYRDGDQPRLNPRLFENDREHLVCAVGPDTFVTFLTPLVREAQEAIQSERRRTKEIPFREIYRSYDGGPREATQRVISTPHEWKAFIQSCKELAQRQQLERKRIDFDKEMAVVVGFGAFRDKLIPYDQMRCGVTKVIQSDDIILVKYTFVRSSFADYLASYPVFVVTLPRSDKRVLFEKHETPSR